MRSELIDIGDVHKNIPDISLIEFNKMAYTFTPSLVFRRQETSKDILRGEIMFYSVAFLSGCK